MALGLTNAPATFNRMMDQIFTPYRHFTGTFFDDIIVFSMSLEEHKEHLALVFEELRKNQLFINAKKSEFFLDEIHYLGAYYLQGWGENGSCLDPCYKRLARAAFSA